jgi:hypothetical protein
MKMRIDPRARDACRDSRSQHWHPVFILEELDRELEKPVLQQTRRTGRLSTCRWEELTALERHARDDGAGAR